MHPKRSESVVTVQHEIHEQSSIEAVARATQHQRNGISPTAPWRFVRDPVKLLLRSLCSRSALYALVAINALPRRLYNLRIAVLPLLSSLFARAQNASQLSILTFQDAKPSKAEGKIQAWTCAGDYCHLA